MHHSKQIVPFPVLLLLAFCTAPLQAEKVLVYDETRGIIFVEKDEVGQKPQKPEIKTPPVKTLPDLEAQPQQPVKPAIKKATTDLHYNRSKDPPDLYFKSGLRYYESENYSDALKNFKYAAEKDIKPEYLLWVGKTYRKLGQTTLFLSTMNRIIDDFSESDVADDALFEIAFHEQSNNNYSESIKFYTKLAEQYPFGLSYSNGTEFLEISRTERQRMRSEIISALSSLGVKADNLEDGTRMFQKKHQLPITALADSFTVSFIKEQFAIQSKQLSETENKISLLADNLHFAYITIVLTIILSSILFATIVGTRKKKREITLMKETVSEMRLQ